MCPWSSGRGAVFSDCFTVTDWIPFLLPDDKCQSPEE